MQGMVVLYLRKYRTSTKNVSKSLECTIMVKVTRSRYLPSQYIEKKCFMRFGG